MAGKDTAGFGIYKDRATAETAVNRLLAEGFSNQDVSVLMSDNSGSKDFATEKNTKGSGGTTAGVGVGGAVGGTLGLQARIGAYRELFQLLRLRLAHAPESDPPAPRVLSSGSGASTTTRIGGVP